MHLEPEPGDVGSKKPHRGRPWAPLRCVLIYPLLAISGCHMLATGSPIPLLWTERLNHPVQVTGCTEHVLILADGRHLRLPFLRRLPARNPVFLDVLSQGVEIRPDGEVYGLLTEPRSCGNDPHLWYTRPINLSELAAVIDPALVDDTVVDPEAIRWLKEEAGPGLDNPRMLIRVARMQARRVGAIFDVRRRKSGPANGAGPPAGSPGAG